MPMNQDSTDPADGSAADPADLPTFITKGAFSTDQFVQYMTALNAAWVQEFGRVFASKPDLRQRVNGRDITPQQAVDAMTEVTKRVLETSGVVSGDRMRALGAEIRRQGQDILDGKVPFSREEQPLGAGVRRQVGGVPR